jgi:hypothetical protein
MQQAKELRDAFEEALEQAFGIDYMVINIEEGDEESGPFLLVSRSDETDPTIPVLEVIGFTLSGDLEEGDEVEVDFEAPELLTEEDLESFSDDEIEDEDGFYEDDETFEEAASGAMNDSVSSWSPLEEARPDGNGLVSLKVIQPGWGTSGYYSPDVLKRDGPNVITAGTKMFWDHPNAQGTQRPERSLRDLAGVLVSSGRWETNGSQGPGLYAKARVFQPFLESLQQMAPYIGVSIRAAGRVQEGAAEGRQGRIVQEIVGTRSVDFVTEPGAGGRILQISESMLEDEILDELVALEEAGVPIDLDDLENPFAGASGEFDQYFDEEHMTDSYVELLEHVQELETQLVEQQLFGEVGDFVDELLSMYDLHPATYQQIYEACLEDPPVWVDPDDNTILGVDFEQLVRDFDETLGAHLGYLEEASGLQDLIPMVSTPVYSLEESFQLLGLTPDSAKQAARGRW